MDDLEIKSADSDVERRALHELLSRYIPGIAPTAVPTLADDIYYRPVALGAHLEGNLIGGLLMCRPQVSAGVATSVIHGGPSLGYGELLDAVFHLDMMAVEADVRREGIGSLLLSTGEDRLRAIGAKILYGSIATSDDEGSLIAFYRARGFRVLDRLQPLPPFLGRQWTLPIEATPEFWFWKRLTDKG